MKAVQREVSTGNIKGTYVLNMPESVAEFVELLATSDETTNVTVNVSGLRRLAELAMKAYLIERDGEARASLKDKPSPSTPKKLAMGF